MTITKYFNANVEDAIRIAVVTADDDDEIYRAGYADSDEIEADDLPADFENWKRYTTHGTAYVSAEIMSRDGD